MKVYLVGGAVRDMLMGRNPKDLDFVVVGSTPEEMVAEGFKSVGKDFPVYIHPDQKGEFALARTERKTGDGYTGFETDHSPEVTLEEDLRRRDLTINAIAFDWETNEIVDPFGGQEDIDNGILRPVSDAFSEDPVRVLRAARFLARHPDFKPSVELINVCDEMSALGELDHLTPERVWKETEGALGEAKTSRYFRFLAGYGIFPEVEAWLDVQEHNKWHPEYDVFEHIMLALDVYNLGSLYKFGVLCHDLGKPRAYAESDGAKSTRHEDYGVPIVDALCDRLRIPNDYRRFGKLCAKYHTHCHISFNMKPKTIHKLLKLFKSQGEFEMFLNVAKADKMGRGKPACDWYYPQPDYMMLCWGRMKNIDRKSITSSMPPGPKLGEAIAQAEIAAIASVDKTRMEAEYVKSHL